MNWNDDRLDRLADQVDHIETKVDSLRLHMDERFEKQDARIQERFEKQEARMTERFARQDTRINERFDRLQTSLVVTLAGTLAAFVGLVVPTVF